MITKESASVICEEEICASALSELESGSPRPGLWAKAFAEAEGDESKSKAIYIRLRVQQEQKSAQLIETELAQKKVAAFSSLLSQLNLKGYQTTKCDSGWMVREPLGGRVKLSSEDSLLEYAKGRIEIPTGLIDPRRLNEQAIPKNNESHTKTFSTTSSVEDFANKDNSVTLSQQEPAGVGGWLLLLVMGMMIFGPLLSAGRIYGEITITEHQYPYLLKLDEWYAFKLATWSVLLIITALSFFGGLGLARGKDWYVVKRAKVILWLTGPVASFVMGVLIPAMTFGDSNTVDGQFAGSFIASIIVTAAWTAYLAKSKRVRNTYIGSQ